MAMLTPVSDNDQDRKDDDLIRQLIENPDTIDASAEASGEGKIDAADDAIDFGDISDGSLDEDFDDGADTGILNNTSQLRQDSGNNLHSFESLSYETNGVAPDEFDDLFGDVNASSSHDKGNLNSSIISYDFDGDEVLGEPMGPVQDDDTALFGPDDDLQMEDTLPDEDVDELVGLTEKEREALLLQRRLFAQAGTTYTQSDDFFDSAPQSSEEALAQMWPRFQKNQVPRFLELMPFKKARWVGKKPNKPPRPVQPTKLKLDIAPDQEKHFKLSVGPHKRKHDRMEDNGLIRIIPNEVTDDSDTGDGGSDVENERIGGVSWEELQTICADWNLLEPEEASDFELLDADSMDIHRSYDKTRKRQKLGDLPSQVQNILNAPRISNQSFDNYEKLLAKAARKVVLDVSDPNLLLVPSDVIPESNKTTNRVGFNEGRVATTKEILKRYNISNDSAYDKLKQNHQSKTRSTLGNLTLNHSMPALRLTYPFYKTNLSRDDRRRLHRPLTTFRRREPITFNDLKFTKKKHQKNREAKEIFASSKDLGLGETSYALMLEYSEEAPTVLSNFGMNSRLISYYRKRNPEDEERPKVNLGEVNVLMPNDTSPLTQFGEIKPGEVRPTIYNAMYKAPVFSHTPKAGDFLMIRSGTEPEYSKWYIRPVENLMVVGQQFPSTEVPPPGGRKVTTVSKNRLKMISYRLMKRSDPPGVNISRVTEHVAESSDMQNRQKMKDFLTFNKESKEWEMQGGAPVPDEDVIRSYISPEDVCLLESMQVGEQRLEDEGYGNKPDEPVDEDEEAKEGSSIEQQLAPWHTTKNFLSAASNKAMLQLYGDGDPTGRGEAFSFLKVSMKGGFRAPNQSIEDTLDAKKRQEASGHNYNVQRQQEQYRETIAEVWAAQNRSLSMQVEHDIPEQDPDYEQEHERRSVSKDPRASFARRTEDDNTSAWSSASQSSKICRIVRKVRNAAGNIVDEVEIVEDPLVWKRYVDIKNKQRRDAIDIRHLRPNDDPELARQKIEAELRRLEGNKERRHAREKAKAAINGDAGSPGASSTGVGKGGSTTRKCANCGMVGHIKTNKKLCPLLNGTSKPEDGGFGDSFGDAFESAPAFVPPPPPAAAAAAATAETNGTDGTDGTDGMDSTNATAEEGDSMEL